MNRKIDIQLSNIEELILVALSRRSKTTEQIKYYLEGKDLTVSSYIVSRTLMNMERLGLVTKIKRSRTYRYELSLEHEVSDED